MKLSQPSLAEIGGVKKGSQILYEKGKAPTADYLERIGEAGVDVLYVITGRRPSGRQSDVSSIDLDRLERSIEVIERGLREAQRDTTPQAKAEMVVAAYEMLEQPSEEAGARILRLVKG